MIKTTDLGIGNLIIPKEGTDEYVTVTDIDEYGMVGTTAFFYDGKGTTGTVSEAAQGIPLTPELLKRFGFVKDRGGWHMPGTQFSLTEQFYPCWLDRMLWPQDVPDFKHLSLKYVHQLQNLYYWLMMGKELTIKETI